MTELEVSCVIEEVTEPTEWCSPAHFCLKPSLKPTDDLRLRIVMDYSVINRRVRWNIRRFPAMSEIREMINPT